MVKKRFDGWLIVSALLLVLFIAVLVYPMFGVIKQAVIMPDGSFSWVVPQVFQQQLLCGHHL